MSQTTMTSKTIVGIFRNDRAAAEAMRSLDAAGFDPDRVHMTEDDPAQAAEIGERTYVREGLIGGALVGLLWVAGFAIWGDLGRDPVGLVVGAIGVVGGMATIGLIVGRTFGHRVPDAGLFARAVRNGGAIVSVRCVAEECDFAAQVLDGAGAREIRDEPGPEAL